MNNLVDFFKALGEETRLRIVQLLSKEEMSIGELIKKLNLSQAAVSHHVKILKQAGLIKYRKNGRWSLYSLNSLGLGNQWDAIQETLIQPLVNNKWQSGEGPNEC